MSKENAVDNHQPRSAINRIYRNVIKRILGFTIALLVSVMLLPIFVIIAILIKLDSQGPVFFTQERLGQGMRRFRIYKFRTMVENAVLSQKAGVEVTLDDVRITRVGRALRRFKIDELAQLFNVINGDMAIVGPRPTLPDYQDDYEAWELKRFDVRPGLTGLAQINGNIYLKREEKSFYDIEYVKKVSFLTDLKIVLKTIAIIIFGEEKFVKAPKGYMGGDR
jgi:undecaprenyl phosphate N,N'-diacetylbacillosamine 1-phosphate transferase